MYEIRLIVNRRADGALEAEWIESAGQRSDPFPLALPLDADDAADLRWYLEEYCQLPGPGDHVRAQGVAQKLGAWGRDLFDAVLGTPEGTQVYNNLLDADPPRLLTLGASDPDVLVQPWELIRDRRGPLAFRDVTVRRQLQGSKKTVRYDLGLPLRVLLIVSRPADAGFINPRLSARPLLDALDALPAGQVRIEFCDLPTLGQLEALIAQARRAGQPYHIVHFDGHGTYLPMTGVGALCFEDDDARTVMVPGAQLGDLLSRLDVPLAMLEACRTADLSQRPVFGSVAPALLESGVGSVVAFSHAVHVEAARLLVERFYGELCAGRSVGAALQEARAALYAHRARWLRLGPDAPTVDLQDWFVPQLYQVGADPVLIGRPELYPEPCPERLPQASREGSAEGPHVSRFTLHGFPPPPLYRFHGRALKLLQIERAFRRYPAVVLTGMGGMGKTALAREAAAWWGRSGRLEAAVFTSFEGHTSAERAVQAFGQALSPGSGQALEGDAFSARSGDEQWQAAVRLFRTRRVLWVWDNWESTLPAFQTPLPGEPALSLQEGPALSLQEEPALSFTKEPALSSAKRPVSYDEAARARLGRLYGELTAPDAAGRLPLGRLLVTCRPAEAGLPGIKEHPLEGLARPDSLYLLAAVLDLKGIALAAPDGGPRPGYERAELERLLDALADHPLSIALVAPHLRTLAPAEIVRDYTRLLGRFADGTAAEGRNRSLLASLAFSRQRLSPAAQAALPYLAWFTGGAFERSILSFAQLDPAAWASIRDELVATALVQVEELDWANTPYLRFHPTLPYAARMEMETSRVSETLEVLEERFIQVYLDVMRMAREALRGRRPAAGMALVAREEGNLRAAMARAFARGAAHPGERQAGWQIADTLGVYLQMGGRLRERDALAAWAKAQMPEDALDEAACDAIRQHAWTRFTRGEAAEAVGEVQALIGRLEDAARRGEPAEPFQIALSYNYLGRIYVGARRPDLAVGPLGQAVAGFERLGERGRPNLSAALGDLANAYRHLGRPDEAMAAAGRGLDINRELGRERDAAAGLGQIAQILTQQGRYAEAEARYEEGLQAARAVGDLGLAGRLPPAPGHFADAAGPP